MTEKIFFWWNNDSDLLFSPLLRTLWTTFLQLFLLISGRDHSQCYESSKIVFKKQHLYIRVHIASWQNVVAHCERPDISKDVDVGLPQTRQAGPALPGPRQDGGLCGDRHDHDRAEPVVWHLWWLLSAPQKSNFKQCELWWSTLEPNTIIKTMAYILKYRALISIPWISELSIAIPQKLNPSLDAPLHF